MDGDNKRDNCEDSDDGYCDIRRNMFAFEVYLFGFKYKINKYFECIYKHYQINEGNNQ